MYRAALVILFLILSGPPARAGDTDKAVGDNEYLEAVVAASVAITRGDEEAAFRAYLPLARRGHAGAQYSVGYMTANGQGVDQDYSEAARWYRLAAEQNHDTAQLSLGMLNWQGKGVPKDLIQAYMWLSLSAAQGQPEAVRSRDELKAQLSADQLQQSEDMVRAWLRSQKTTG